MSSSTSLAKLENIFDDDGEGKKRLEKMLMPTGSMKTRYDRPCETPNCVVCPNGRQGDCAVSTVIYLTAYQLCGAEYIGKTEGALRTWVKEHLDGFVKSKSSIPLGAHRRQCRGNTHFNIAVTILTRESDVLARKALKAFYVTTKSLTMNRKEECVVVTNELAPYQDLCGF